LDYTIDPERVRKSLSFHDNKQLQGGRMIVGLYDKGPQIVTVLGQIDCLKCGQSRAWLTCISVTSLQGDIEREKGSLAKLIGSCTGTKDHVWRVTVSYRPSITSADE
jgi:hypothetical protein